MDNDIVEYSSKRSILLLGDFNSRTGTHEDFINNDNKINTSPIINYTVDGDLPIRNSQDKNYDSNYGKQLLEIAYHTSYVF